VGSDFTNTELVAAAESLLTQDDAAGTNTMGVADTEAAFNKVREMLAGAFQSDPSLIFSVAQAAVNKLTVPLKAAVTSAADIYTAAGELSRTPTPITGTSLLADAATALRDVQGVIAVGNVVPSGPLARYIQAVDSFVDKSLAPNVKTATGGASPATYTISRPPAAAQQAIQSQLALLQGYNAEIVAGVAQILRIVSDFKAVNITAIASSTAITLVRKGLLELKAAYDGDSDYAAVGRSRDAFLQLQAGRVILPQATALQDPEAPKMAATGTSGYSMMAFSPAAAATAAKITGTKSGPYVITSANKVVTLAVDGGADQSFALTEAASAGITGRALGPFDVHGSQKAYISSAAGPFTIPASPNNVMKIYVDGECYSGALTPGAMTPTQLETAWKGLLNELGWPLNTAQVDFSVASGAVVITYKTTGKHEISVGKHAALNTALGFADEWSSADSYTTKGMEANNKIRFLVDRAHAVEVTIPSGSSQTAATVAASLTGTYLTGSDASGYVRVASKSAGSSSSVEASPTDDVHRAAVALLGMDLSSREWDVELPEVIRQVSMTLTGAMMTSVDTVLEQGVNGTAVLDGGHYKLRLPTGSVTVGTVDDTLLIRAGANAGKYPITAVVTAGGYQYLTVSRPLTTSPTEVAVNQSWVILRDMPVFTSSTVGLTSRLEVKAAGPLGMSGVSKGAVSALRVRDTLGVYRSFKKYGVCPGDIVLLGGPSYTTTHTVVSVEEFQVEVTPEVPNDLVGHLFTIKSPGLVSYSAFRPALLTWQTGFSTWRDLGELDRILTPLLVSENPTQVGSAQQYLQTLQAQYATLQGVLGLLAVPRAPALEKMLSMLVDRGMDRAHDMLLSGQVKEVFSLDSDAVSYSGAMQAAAAAVVQNTLNVTRMTATQDDTGILTQAVGTDADEDFSDMDDETDTMATDDMPDVGDGY